MIHPIEYRYGTEEMKSIFDDKKKLELMLRVEAALVKALHEVGFAPREAWEEVSKKANLAYVKPDRVKEIEAEIRHDVMALVRALSEVCSEETRRYIHLGATSNDIVDTATALQIREALELIERKLINLIEILLDLARRYKKLVCVGRTHGQHAIPMTYGMKFALWADEFYRHLERLREARSRILVGKLTGAVGTQAALVEYLGDPDLALRVQEIMMEELGLKPARITNQIVQRDVYAEMIFLLALIATSLEKIGTEIRNLQRTEIAELSEAFGEKQVGSSTMPHKRNPIVSERICSLARIVRSHVIVALENIPLWHERDLTNSASERIIIPESFILTDYILKLAIDLLGNLELNEVNIRRNLELTRGLILSERVMIALVKKGLGRQEAHELVRRLAMKAYEERRSLRDVLLESDDIRKYLSKEEIEELMNPESYLGTSEKIVEKVIEEISRSLS